VPATPNDDAWVKVPLCAAVGYVVLLAVVLPMSDGSRVAVAGWLLLPVVLATGLLVLVATSTRRRWDTRTYAAIAPVTVLALTAVVGGVLQVSPPSEARVSTAEPRSVAELAGSVEGPDEVEVSAPAVPQVSTATLVAPATGGGWTRVERPEDQVADAELAQWTSDLYGVADVVVGSYQLDTSPGIVFRYVGVNGPIADTSSPEAAGRAALVSATGSTVTTFPPASDGWLGCNTTSAQGVPRISCAWVGEERAVFLRWDSADISLAYAATVTRSFRDAASVPG
jgi:hypothetical protein